MSVERKVWRYGNARFAGMRGRIRDSRGCGRACQRRAYGVLDNERAGWAGLKMSVVHYGVSDNGEPEEHERTHRLGVATD